MSIQTDISWITEALSKHKDPSVINYIKNFLLSLEKDTERATTVEQYNQEIDIALEQYRNGNYLSETDADEIVKGW